MLLFQEFVFLLRSVGFEELILSLPLAVLLSGLGQDLRWQQRLSLWQQVLVVLLALEDLDLYSFWLRLACGRSRL